jgi:quinol-cytochrome oxidoreductase complex cytochrome b subunit
MSVTSERTEPPETEVRPTWTGRLRRRAVKALPPDKLLPDTQPAYVASWIYIFGALTLAAFAVVVLSGAVIAIKGPAWWHVSSVGLFFNSMHLWSTELFFFFMVVHLWGKFFMAAWRGKRRATWVTGGLAFVISIATAFTGYLSQQNFDSEWISTQAKDGINATGAGAFWNVLNFGQMLMWHIVLLPAVVSLFIVVHVLLVRRRGVVPPFADAKDEGEAPAVSEVGSPAVGSPAVSEVGSPAVGSPAVGAPAASTPAVDTGESW